MSRRLLYSTILMLSVATVGAAEYPPLDEPIGQDNADPAQGAPGWQDQYPPLDGADAGANPWQPGQRTPRATPPTGDQNPWRSGPDTRAMPAPDRSRPARPYAPPPPPPASIDLPPYGGWPGGYGGNHGGPGFGGYSPWTNPFSPWGIPGWGWPGQW